MTTLTIKDLSVHAELDGKAMSAVRGGDDQANGVSQLNGQNMAAANNVANGLLSAGPISVQSYIDNTQTASNTSYQYNFSGFEVYI